LLPLPLRLPAASMKTVAWDVLCGITVGLGWVGYVSALQTVPVSTVGVLYMTCPVFTLLVGWLMLGESIGPWQWIACLLVTLAILITPARATRKLSTQMVVPRKPG
jgi:drug/metabolite transporter (DMT)-like permease